MFCGIRARVITTVLGMIVIALVLVAIGVGGPATAVGSTLTGVAIVGYQTFASHNYGA